MGDTCKVMRYGNGAFRGRQRCRAGVFNDVINGMPMEEKCEAIERHLCCTDGFQPELSRVLCRKVSGRAEHGVRVVIPDKVAQASDPKLP